MDADVGIHLMKLKQQDINDKVISTIVEIINKGNTVEVKKVRDEIVVIELQRKVKIKHSTSG